MSATDTERWIRESLGDGMDRLWRLDGVLWEGDTDYQHVVIGKTAQGVSLFCDDDRQSTEFSQLVYHEAMVVPAFLLTGQPRRVLVIGSSEGVVCQMSVRAGAEQVDHVDIDRTCVRQCAEHLPYGYSSNELDAVERGEGPIHLQYADGWSFLTDAIEQGQRYDIVVVDLPDEREDEGQHNRLYGEEYLSMCKQVLAPGGVVAFQAGCPTLWRNTTLKRSLARFNATFGTTVYFGSDEHEWSFLFGLAEQLENPTDRMRQALPASGYRPVSIDDQALIACTIPPHDVRHA